MQNGRQAEFKREAVRLSEQVGTSVAQTAQELGVSDYSLYKWRKQARERGELAFPGNGNVALSAEQQENVRLKKELERLVEDNDPFEAECYEELLDIFKRFVAFVEREAAKQPS